MSGFPVRRSRVLQPFVNLGPNHPQPVPRPLLRLASGLGGPRKGSPPPTIRGGAVRRLVPPPPRLFSVFNRPARGGRPVTRIKALLYARGCAIQTLDLPVSGSNNQQYSFICLPLASVWIVGALTRMDRLYGREIKLQAKYIARWSQSFLELGDGIVTTIPVGDVAYLSPDGRFRLSVPDFSQDPLAGAPDHPGELQIWATDQASDGVVALLIPAGPQVIKTRMGGLKIRSEYPSEIVFAPCAANPPQVHDAQRGPLRFVSF